MAAGGAPHDDRIEAGDRHDPRPQDAGAPDAPAWIAASAAAFRQNRSRLVVIRRVRAAGFGGVLVFAALLALLLRHRPDGESLLLPLSLVGLPLCAAAWLVAGFAHRRLTRTKNHIEGRMYDAGMHIDDQGRVLTDNPHAVLISSPRA